MPAHQATRPAQAEIARGLLDNPASISPKYFYDAAGSAIFERITRLPEYYPTRIEREIMAENAIDIARRVGPGRTLIELGAGNCEKARELCTLIRPERFVAVDISSEFLDKAAGALRADFPGIDVRTVAADLAEDIAIPENIARQQRLVFYPGSSIGNFDLIQAHDLLARIRGLLEDDGALLIGVDLVKDLAALEAAYDDPAGVTAEFNLNVLKHVNRLIGSDFAVSDWRHRAFFNTDQSRIEMHLEAARRLRIAWPDGERAFARGERIHTENSYKYRLADFVELLASAGFARTQAWTDERQWFGVLLAQP